MIPVTKPFLPPIQEYEQYLQDIWKRNWLTNNGPLVYELELRLKDFLGLKHLLFVTNGTVAIQLAIKAKAHANAASVAIGYSLLKKVFSANSDIP